MWWLCALSLNLYCQDAEAERLVNELLTLPDYSPEVIERNPALRRLVVLDVQALPALDRALASKHVTQRAVAAIALRNIARMQSVVKLIHTEPDPGLKQLFTRMCVEDGWLGDSPNAPDVPEDALRASGVSKAAIERIVATKIGLSAEETQERCKRLLKLLDAPTPINEADSEHDRVRGILCGAGIDAIPLMAQELRATMSQRSVNAPRAVSLAIAITSNVSGALREFQNREGDSKLLALDHKDLLELALELSSSALDRVRSQAAHLLTRIAAFEHEKLTEFSAKALKRLEELSNDRSRSVSEAARSGLRYIQQQRAVRAQAEDSRRRAAERQRKVQERDEALARAYESNVRAHVENADAKAAPSASSPDSGKHTSSRSWSGIVAVALAGACFGVWCWRRARSATV